MKTVRHLLLLVIVMSLTVALVGRPLLQVRGTPQIVGGTTSSSNTPITLLVDSDGTLHTTGVLAANQSVNVAQINGITPLMGNGVTGTGSQRVTIASDNTAFSVNIGTFPDNEPVNVAQMNGVAVTMGNGVAGTGVQRVAVASDNTPFAVKPFTDGTLASGAVTSAMTGTTSTSVIGGTGSNYIYVTQCTTSNSSTTVSTDINLQDGSGGTTLYVLPAPAASVATTGGSGGSYSFPIPLKVPTVGNGLFAANVTTGSSTKISCSGYKSTTSY